MIRITAAAIATLLLPVWTIGCEGENPTAFVANQAPVANAGQDVSRVDADGDGYEEFALNGSASRDVDGVIVEHLWLEKDDAIANGVEPTHSFAVGVHDVTLVVTDDRGGMDSDGITIVVEPIDVSDPPSDPQPNTAPRAFITMPCDGFRSYEGRGMYFGGEGIDAEEGRLANDRFEWTYDGQPIRRCDSDWDGRASACGDGGWIESIELGPHVLTFTVTDREGAEGSASITMTGVEFQNASFTADILSFLLYACETCHGTVRAEGGIRLDSYDAIMTGGNEHGPLIVEGDPTGGILIPQILSDHLIVDSHGIHMSQWMGETILPVWIVEGARNTDHPHPPYPEPRCGVTPE